MSLLVCCNSKNQINQDAGYCKILDTIYKNNSTDIESITRTFYIKGDTSRLSDFFAIQQQKGGKDFVIIIHDDENLNAIVLNEEKLKDFISNSRIIIKNKGKDLKYDINNLKTASMSHSVSVENGINVFSSFNEKSVSFELSNDDIDNIEKAYSKFIQEK